ncbi:MAG: inorganic diphosphatase, partial [Acidimicrobiales bacterium]
LTAALVYPADYGFIVETLAEDGDALDALLLISEPTFPGCRVEVRPLAVLWMEDEHGPDPKLITALPSAADYEGWADIGDLPRRTLDEIEHFFTVYKDLEEGSSARTHGYEGSRAAETLVTECQERFLKAAASGG